MQTHRKRQEAIEARRRVDLRERLPRGATVWRTRSVASWKEVQSFAARRGGDANACARRRRRPAEAASSWWL